MNELVKWQQKVDDYLRQRMHQLATVERVCGIKNGPIAKEAGNYDRNGMRGVNLAALLLFMPIGLDAQGKGTFTFPVPNSTALVGVNAYAQAFSGAWLTRYETIFIR